VAALFTDLHEVAQVLAEHIREEVGIVDVQPGAPRDVGASAEPAARIMLLYTTPQPTHRNDPLEPQPDGTSRHPPLALSCFYLVTTSGANEDDPIAAHHALGRIMTLYNDHPSLDLPLSDDPSAPPGAFTELGEGVVSVVQVPIALDQVDKIWTSLDVQLQPWALFEVSPVQLISQLEDRPPAPVVRPGGIGLDVRAGTRPLIVRVTPEAVRAGGRVRIDVIQTGAAEAVAVDGIEVPVGDPSLTVAASGAPLLLTLDDGGLEALAPGAHPLTVRASGLVSRRGVLRVAQGSAPAVDAPAALRHDAGDDLVLSGANLGDAQEAVVWPDVGIAAPTDVHSIPLSAVAAGSITVPSAGGLADLPAARGPWRLTIRVGDHVYTPHVVLELGS
jgi:hypothetical protein